MHPFILPIILALFGFLPLITFLYKQRKANRILTEGQTITARVFYKVIGYKRSYEVVHYYFIAPDGREYKGQLTTSIGKHRLHDTIKVYYLPHNPKHNTVKGSWSSTGFLIFMILIALAVLYMSYKLYETLKSGSM